MNYGSEQIWVYSDCSDEEYVSEGELEVGMWLSDSDEDGDLPPAPSSPPKLTPFAAVLPPAPPPPPQDLDLEGSTTKYLPPVDSPVGSDDNTDDDTDDDNEEQGPQAAGAAAGGRKDGDGGKGKSLNYAVLEMHEEDKAVAGKKKNSRPHPLGPLIYPIKKKPASKKKAAPPSPPPPPPPPVAPPPIRGILKNRLDSQPIKRVKQARKWGGGGSRNPWREKSRSPEVLITACLHGVRNRDRGRVWRRSDTNILAVKFNKLIEPSDVHTGDPVLCRNKACLAVLSHLSAIKEQPDKEEKVWLCEFCGEHNDVDIVPEEVPTKMDTTFLISPAPVPVGVAASGGVANTDESLVVFCIDISGSMCVTTEVAGKFELKGHERVKELSSLNVDKEDQFLPGQRRDVTYVSRLQSVQAAVDYQISQLARTNPSQRIALVTFSDEVSVIGDGRGEVINLAGDKLWKSDEIVKIGKGAPLPASVSMTAKSLSKKVFELEEGGQTALGPALLVSISLAAQVPGSKVIICTDGLANRGVGNLDDLKSVEDRAAAQTFYEDMGTLALEDNVIVSLVRIKGTDCKAAELGQVADTTGGQVTIVDPLNITKEFSSILANPVLATNVKTKIILHGQLYFRTEESKESVLTIPVGNVTAETELTYEYGVRHTSSKNVTKDESKPSTSPPPPPSGATPIPPAAPPTSIKVPPLELEGKPHFPFQLQIEYTGRDGSRCMRVITEAKPVTKDREQAEKHIDMAVVGTHVARRTAKLAMEGEYTHARLNALSTQRLLKKSSHNSAAHREKYTTVMSDIIPLENELKTKQQSEVVQFGRQYSDNEEEEDLLSYRESALAPQASKKKAAPKKKKAISRRKEISDDLATYCYNMKSSSYM